MPIPRGVHELTKYGMAMNSEFDYTERWSRESGSVAAASSELRLLELAVLTAYLAGESFPEPIARPNPPPHIPSALA